jgi:hypothetical protein
LIAFIFSINPENTGSGSGISFEISLPTLVPVSLALSRNLTSCCAVAITSDTSLVDQLKELVLFHKIK